MYYGPLCGVCVHDMYRNSVIYRVASLMYSTLIDPA
jgi:hypothetical protein